MAVSPELVKQLRDKTGVGFGDCKKALDEANGDLAQAEKILKEKGLASAAKRAARANDEGRVFLNVSGKKAGLLQLACETDFVARNSDFVSFGESLARELVSTGSSALSPAQDSAIKDLGAKIKENISVKAVALAEAGSQELLGTYVHMVNEVGRIGVIVTIKAADAAKVSHPRLQELAGDLALTVAAYNPLYLNKEAVPASYVAEQQELFKNMVAQDEKMVGKPEKAIQSAVEGKLKKLLADLCFVDKPFIRDEKVTVTQALATVGKELGTSLEIVGFRQLRIGQDA